MRKSVFAAGGLIAGALLASPTGAAEIVLDYTHDNFFGTNTVARAALEQAALDVSNVLTTNLGAVTDMSTGVSGSTSATFDIDVTYTNPATGTSATRTNSALSANEVRIFVGARNLSFPTLGEGGPAGISLSLDGFGFPSQWPDAVANASAAADANFSRGDGPVIYQVDGSSTWDGYQGNYSISYGASFGHLWFDNDTNWHLDHLAPVAAGKIDLYSVALHEILHSVGFSTADSFDAQRGADINDWTGPAVLALLGTGDEILTNDGHVGVAIGTRAMTDGLPLQEALMFPSIADGTRKYITELDLAFLQDMGWDVVAIPEPSAVALLCGVPMLLLGRRRRRGA